MTDSTTRQTDFGQHETGPNPGLLFGLPIDPLASAEVLARAERAIRDRQRLLIGVVNAAKIAKLKADPLLRDSLLDADVLLADGQSVVWASRLLRRPLPERVAGIDLFESLLGSADRHAHRVFLLGARPEVVQQVEAVIHERWPGAVVVGARDGYFTPDQADDVAAEIRVAKPDMLFLGITTPKKEIFLGRYGDELGVPVLHGVGGSFDVLAGITRRAPIIWQRLGMEWAYRVLQEPTRLAGRYLVTNLVFLGLLAVEMVHRHSGYARAPKPLPADAGDPAPALATLQVSLPPAPAAEPETAAAVAAVVPDSPSSLIEYYLQTSEGRA